MLRELSKCIREYRRQSIMAPLLVSMEVVMECIIPFIIAKLVNQLKAGADFSEIAVFGLVLIVICLCCLESEREIPAPPPPAALPKMYAKICSTRSRTSHLKTLTAFLHHPW